MCRAEFLSDVRPQKQNACYDDDASDSDDDNTSTRAAAVHPVVTSPRGPQRTASQRKPRRQGSAKAGLNRNRSGFFNEEGNASISHLQLAMEGEEEPPRSARRQSPSPRPVSSRDPVPTRDVVEVPPPAEPQGYHQIPFASPVFLMDPEANLPPPEFWQLWKQTKTTCVPLCSAFS